MKPASAVTKDGMLGIIKPPGMTSHDVVGVARRVLGTRRVGHAGTLDPLAAGVLPILVGAATRLSDLLLSLPKTYRAEILFGVSSDTGDLGGVVVAAGQVPHLEAGAVHEAIASLVGRRLQTPPAYSARQVDGRRLYDIARSGGVSDEILAQTAREVEVYSAELLSLKPVKSGPFAGHPAALMTVSCSSGTYVRELAEHAGRSLGTAACLSFLVRTMSAGVAIDDCVTMDELLELRRGAAAARAATTAWRSPADAVGFLPAAVLGPADSERVARSGAAIPVSAVGSVTGTEAVSTTTSEASVVSTIGAAAESGVPAARASGLIRLLGPRGELIALARREGEFIRPVKVLAGERGSGTA